MADTLTGHVNGRCPKGYEYPQGNRWGRFAVVVNKPQRAADGSWVNGLPGKWLNFEVPPGRNAKTPVEYAVEEMEPGDRLSVDFELRLNNWEGNDGWHQNETYRPLNVEIIKPRQQTQTYAPAQPQAPAAPAAPPEFTTPPPSYAPAQPHVPPVSSPPRTGEYQPPPQTYTPPTTTTTPDPFEHGEDLPW